MTKTNKYSVYNSRDFIPKRRKYECTNGAQTHVVWAFSNVEEMQSERVFKRLCGLSAVLGDWGISQQAKMHQVYTDVLLANL